MLLMDLNGVVFSSLMASLGKHTHIEIETPILRHMVLNVIRANNKMFRKDYGTLVIAADSLHHWRRDFFPHYKASRRKARKDSDINWPSIFRAMDQIKQEIQNHLPYKYICVDGAEADDVIGVLAQKVTEPTLILSTDKDYIQLHNQYIKQYDPVSKNFISREDPQEFLFDHILRGDHSDGVPNITSPDNVFVLGVRQKPVTQKLKESLRNIDKDPESKYYRNWIRNKTLIDLRETPEDIQGKILDIFENQEPTAKSKLFGYLASSKLPELASNISDF